MHPRLGLQEPTRPYPEHQPAMPPPSSILDWGHPLPPSARFGKVNMSPSRAGAGRVVCPRQRPPDLCQFFSGTKQQRLAGGAHSARCAPRAHSPHLKLEWGRPDPEEGVRAGLCTHWGDACSPATLRRRRRGSRHRGTEPGQVTGRRRLSAEPAAVPRLRSGCAVPTLPPPGAPDHVAAGGQDAVQEGWDPSRRGAHRAAAQVQEAEPGEEVRVRADRGAAPSQVSGSTTGCLCGVRLCSFPGVRVHHWLLVWSEALFLPRCPGPPLAACVE
ncbi:hypothetical protein NDU88_001239 [Pleurodeles waltl]|uniref:Uncharacterized protein n=1 Tax=Pleurodeles waltl TaxID=8319 RepID=A0AAV7U5Y0_PLEWA|nr:hypothetical protein NDU88_001239 [Pleurodeles waltl]